MHSPGSLSELLNIEVEAIIQSMDRWWMFTIWNYRLTLLKPQITEHTQNAPRYMHSQKKTNY